MSDVGPEDFLFLLQALSAWTVFFEHFRLKIQPNRNVRLGKLPCSRFELFWLCEINEYS
jgi:hypothetical protein